MRNSTGLDFLEDLTNYNPYVLSKYNKRLSLALNLTGVSFLVYFVLLALKLDGALHDSFIWSYQDIPIGIALVSLSFAVVYFVGAEHQRVLNPGKRLVQISIIIFSICVFGFIVLQNFKNDGLISWSYALIFAPLYLKLAIILFGLIFILPGMFDKDNQYFGEAAMFIIDFFLFFAFLVMICLKLEDRIKLSYPQIFAFVFAVIGVNLIFLVAKIQKRGFVSVFKDMILLLFAFIFCVLLVLAIERMVQVSWLVVFSPLLVLVLAFEWYAMRSFLELMTAKAK